jgi:Ca2+-binding EF-hand superfamily protein
MKIVKLDEFKFSEENNRILGATEENIAFIRDAISSDKVVILKNVFSKNRLLEIREAVFEYFKTNKESNPLVNGKTPNYHRVDNNPPKSAVKRIAHKYISFYWNRDLAGETTFMKAMSMLKNRIANLEEEFTIHGIEKNGYISLPNITQYPKGGGRLNKHIDPENIQFTVMIASMSERGADFSTGGVYVEEDGKKHYLDDILEIGDIFLFKPSLVHGVDDIDPEIGYPQWNDIGGRWILFPTLIELKTTRGENVEGLKDLERYS